MKALLMDVSLILLILAGTAGADGPAYLADTLQASADDLGTSTPKYTPVPASRKKPSNDNDAINERERSSTNLAQQLDFESLPMATGHSRTVVRSEFIPADSTAKQPAKLAVAPISEPVAGYDYAPAPGALPVPSGSVEVPTISGPSVSGRVVLPPPPGPVQVPATIYSSREPSYAYKPLVPVVATPPTIHLGRGILGQPTVYVPGQPVRNFFRYFSP